MKVVLVSFFLLIYLASATFSEDSDEDSDEDTPAKTVAILSLLDGIFFIEFYITKTEHKSTKSKPKKYTTSYIDDYSDGSSDYEHKTTKYKPKKYTSTYIDDYSDGSSDYDLSDIDSDNYTRNYTNYMKRRNISSTTTRRPSRPPAVLKNVGAWGCPTHKTDYKCRTYCPTYRSKLELVCEGGKKCCRISEMWS